MAQVYSVNVVGYVNATVQPGKWAILANPLNNGDNGISTVMPLPDTAASDGTTVFRFDATTQAFRDSITFYQGSGWFSASDNSPKLAPGEGFFIQAPIAPAPALNLTFVGEVPQGTLTVPLAGTGRYTLAGSMVPQEGRIGAAGVGFPGADGDTIFVWDAATQAYLDSYTYYDAIPGWFSASDADPTGPNIPVAMGFWVQKGTTSPAVNWTRTFTVQ